VNLVLGCSLCRSCCLDEVCVLSSLLGLLGGEFVVLDADVRRFR
jgi:hypothetical protein